MENRAIGFVPHKDRTATSHSSAPPGEAGAAHEGLPVGSTVIPGRLRHWVRELIPVVVTLGLGSFVLLQTPNIRSRAGSELGPQFWPELLGWTLIGLGLVLVLTAVLRKIRQSDLPDEISRWGAERFGITAIVLVGYLLLWNVLQFWLITIVTITVLSLVYGVRGWKPLIIFPVIVGLLLHVLFVLLLRVPL